MRKKINWSKWMCVLTKTMTNKQTLCDLLPAFIKWKVYHFLLSGVKECMYLYEQMSAKCEASMFQNNFIPLLKKKKKKISAKCHWLSSPMFFFFLCLLTILLKCLEYCSPVFCGLKSVCLFIFHSTHLFILCQMFCHGFDIF